MYEITYPVKIAGRLTRDPEKKFFEKDGNEGSFVRGTVAVNRNKEVTDFFNYVAFGSAGDFLFKYLKKGTPVMFEGRLQTGSYKKEDGTTVYTTELNVLRVTSEMGGNLYKASADLIGRLTKDPSISMTEKGNKMARFTLAIDRPTRTKGEESIADFIPVVLFGKHAESAEKYFHKGMKVNIEGRVQNRDYESNGVKRRTTEVVGSEVRFARSASADNQAQPAPEQDAPAVTTAVTTQPETTETKVADTVPAPAPQPDADDILTGFINIDDDDDDELPFN